MIERAVSLEQVLTHSPRFKAYCRRPARVIGAAAAECQSPSEADLAVSQRRGGWRESPKGETITPFSIATEFARKYPNPPGPIACLRSRWPVVLHATPCSCIMFRTILQARCLLIARILLCLPNLVLACSPQPAFCVFRGQVFALEGVTSVV